MNDSDTVTVRKSRMNEISLHIMFLYFVVVGCRL